MLISTQDLLVRNRKSALHKARLGQKSALKKGHCSGSTVKPDSGRVYPEASIVAQLVLGATLEQGVSPEHIRYQKISGKARRNVLFLIDTSASMLSVERLAMVKGCVESLLQQAYVARTRVALVSFGGAQAKLVLPFTSSAELAASRVEAMCGGGGTHFIQGLNIASQLIESLTEPVDLVILSDGRVSRERKRALQPQLAAFAHFCAVRACKILLVDASHGNKTARQRAEHLAQNLHAHYVRLPEMRADALTTALSSL